MLFPHNFRVLLSPRLDLRKTDIAATNLVLLYVPTLVDNLPHMANILQRQLKCAHSTLGFYANM
jgi:hypothetical protein